MRLTDEQLTFDAWWIKQEFRSTYKESIFGPCGAAWNARQPEIDALKLELAESERISSGRLETMNALYAETAKLKIELDAAETAALERAAIIAHECTGWYEGKGDSVGDHAAEEIRARITPNQSSALELVKAQARLEEAKWWEFQLEIYVPRDTSVRALVARINELEAAAGRKS